MRWLAALAALTALALAGCTDDPEPIIVAPTETPTSASPTVEPTPTDEPLTQREQERALIEAWVAAFSESLSTGDPKPWLALSDPDCSNCAVFARNLEAAYSDGGRIEGASWTPTKVRFREMASVGAVWDVDVTQTEERWLDGSGELVKTVHAGVNKLEFAVVGPSPYSLFGIQTR